MIKAIQTRYKGYNFRSRLEARWAVFFDALGIVWEYEPEGFELPNGERYLPDFRIPDRFGRYLYLEVKPAVRNDAVLRTMLVFAAGGESIALLAGEPTTKANYVIHGATSKESDPEDYHQNECWEDAFVFEQHDSKYSPCYYAFGGEFLVGDEYPWRYSDGMVSLQRAVNAARSARFEFGEKGAT